MKLQDKYPFDSTLFGLNNQYIPKADNSFLINYPCIVANDHIVTTGHTYMLVNSNHDGSIDNVMVKLIDVYCDNININLVILDILKLKELIVQLNALDAKIQSQWLLIDMSYIRDEIERFVVQNYCGCSEI